MTARYEVFLKKEGKDEFRHAGALDAATDDLALLLAREAYVRRGEGDHLWLVRRDHILEEDPAFIAPNTDKPHRHHDGQAVAESRRSLRESADD